MGCNGKELEVKKHTYEENEERTSKEGAMTWLGEGFTFQGFQDKGKTKILNFIGCRKEKIGWRKKQSTFFFLGFITNSKINYSNFPYIIYNKYNY